MCNVATTGDHVIAREFFLEGQRGGLPKVPACERCNHLKSQLEHYLTAVLPFGGVHPNAVENLTTMVPKRLERNLRLRAELGQGIKRTTRTFLPLDGTKLLGLSEFIAKGLIWYHWGVYIGPGYSSRAMALTESGASALHQVLFGTNPRSRVSADLGHGTFSYEGEHAPDAPQTSWWRLSLCGGVSLGEDPSTPDLLSREIFVATGQEDFIQAFGLEP